MNIRKTAGMIAKGAAGVALATAGCNSIFNTGAVDPAPQPLVCNDDTKQGKSLYAAGTLWDTTLTVEVRMDWAYMTNFVEPQVINPHNATVTSVVVDPSGMSVKVVLELPNSSVTSGSFTFKVKAVDASRAMDTSVCEMMRTFTFTIDAGKILLAQGDADALPLGVRHQTAIAMVKRENHTVHLGAKTTAARPTFTWTVSGGSIASIGNDGACWQLPEKQGLYQARVVADFGDDGLAFDVINLEVV